MFLFALLALGLIGIGALLAGGIGSAGAWMLGGLFFVGKLFLILLLFGLISGFFWRSSQGRPPWAVSSWRRPSGRAQPPQGKSRDEEFEDWHRVAHAREEVDSWAWDPEDEPPASLPAWTVGSPAAVALSGFPLAWPGSAGSTAVWCRKRSFAPAA